MTTRVTQTVAEFCQKHALLVPGDKVVVGVSGGPDSLCLLHLLNTLKTELELNLNVAHFNHQLRRDDANADENFVRNIAADWHLPLWIDTQNVAMLAAARKQSIEEAARQVRYAFLWWVALKAGATKIAVGHNADDQVETVLMHFLRGSGLTGLRGMLPATDIAALRLHPDDQPAIESGSTPEIIRPLLGVSRSEIETYCVTHNLRPRQDTSNQDTTFFRNRLRHELIPYLETYNPNIRCVLQNMTQVVNAEVAVLNEHLDKAWHTIKQLETPERIDLNLKLWLSLPLALKRSTLRRAVQHLRRDLRDLNFEHIKNAIFIVEKGETGSKATLPHGLILTVDYDTLTIAAETTGSGPLLDFPHLAKNQVVPVKLPGLTPLPGTNWHLQTRVLSPGEWDDERLSQVDQWEVFLDAQVVGPAPMLRPRQSGERFHPLGLGGHSQKVSDFMINQKIPSNWRDHIPLLMTDEQVLWVCGYRPDERACIRSTSQHVVHLEFNQN